VIHASSIFVTLSVGLENPDFFCAKVQRTLFICNMEASHKSHLYSLLSVHHS